MALRNTASTYGSVAKFFHWLIFILVFFMVIAGFLLENLPKDYQAFAYNAHKLTGLTILCLMVLRGLWALTNPKPKLPPETLSWERFAERSVHFLLYFFIIAMPLAGWIGAVAGGRPPHLGSIDFNLPIAKNKALAEAAFNMHYIFAICIITLVTIHVVAALFHHYIRKDGILLRMLPGNRR